MKREGSLERCSVCRATLPIPTEILGEIRCPRCSARLWYLVLASGPSFFVQRTGETIYDLLADLAGSREGFSAAEIERVLRDADSLDVAEFLWAIQDAVQS